MGIEDIQISEELETNAPSIKYSGNEGPKSPQQMQKIMMAQLEEEYLKYVDDMMEQGIEPMSMQQFIDQAMAEGQMAGGNPLPNRQMAAYGGIMGMDGRRQYGLGSSLKKFVRKIIPNEIAEVAVKAAPFVAPFNPLAAGLMSGIGSFDQTGRIGSSLKSGLMNYAMGQGARYLGGADFQKGINPLGGFSPGTTGTGTFSKYFSKPTGSGGIKNLFADKASTTQLPESFVKANSHLSPEQQLNKFSLMTDSEKSRFLTNPNKFDAIGFDEFVGETPVNIDQAKIISDNPVSKLGSKIMEYVPTSLGDLNPLGKNFDIKKAVGAFGIYKTAEVLLGGPNNVEDQIMDRGEGLDLAAIRKEVQEAFQDETGAKLKALRVKYPYLGRADTKDFAMGGRIGKAEGGIMDLGGMEKDYRAEGGFVPIGKAEKADDVPARLSVNEFVFTADAVRNAGGGDIDKGAEVMENMMKNLEQGGRVSAESQGMAGAQQMFETSQRLSEVM